MRHKLSYKKWPAVSGIYCIWNLKDGKIYVGSAVDLKERLHQHYKELTTNQHFNQHLQRAWNKYGEKNFKAEILSQQNVRIEFPSTEYNALLKEEDSFIMKYQALDPIKGYNKRLSDTFPIISEESKAKRKAKHDQHKIAIVGLDKDTGKLLYEWESVTEAAKALNDQTTNISWARDNSQRSIKDVLIVTKSLYDPNKTYKHTKPDMNWNDEHREKARRANVANVPIYEYSLEGDLTNEYYSCSDATRKVAGLSPDGLSHILKYHDNIIKYNNKIYSKTKYIESVKELQEMFKNVYEYLPGVPHNQTGICNKKDTK